MSSRHLTTIAIAVVTFLIGFGLGMLYKRAEIETSYQRAYYLGCASQAATTVSALKRLQKGQTQEATELLELDLNGLVVILDAHEQRIGRSDSNVVKALGMAREYKARTKKGILP